MTEQEILKAVKECLQLYGFRVFRRNTGGGYALQLGRERFVRFSEPGAADLTGWEIGTGRCIEVEVKKPNGRTHPKRALLQQTWLSQAQRDGCIAFQASSVEECVAALEQYGFAKRILC